MRKQWKLGVNCIFALALVVMTCMPAFTQTITGSITGTVTDPTGAVVSGAKVTATNVQTGIATPTTTNPSGIYYLRFLQIGQYKISVDSPNFNSQTTNAFTLEVDQEAKINIALQVGSASTNVVVTDTAPIMNTEDATTGGTITAAAATELPVQSRNFSSLTLLVAGAISPNPQALDNVGRGAYNGGFFINGNREQSNNYTLDGADINEAIDNYIGYSPNVDALGEIRIISGNGTAEYGNANGGQVVMVTKSGTNHFHGNLFFFGENQKLNANTWAAKQTGASRAPLNRAMFGGTLGGPILRDKLFFFIDYQGARQHASTVENRTVIAASDRNLAGIANPNPAAVYLFAHPELYPLPNTSVAGSSVNYVGSSAQATQNDQADAKIDWKATNRDNISGRFSIGREHSGYSRVALPTDIPTNNNDPYTGFITNWTHVLSNSIINEARAGYGRTRYIQTPTDVSGNWGLTGNSKLGIPGQQLVPGFSTLVIGNGNNGTVNDIGAPQGQDGNGAYGGIDSDSIVNAFTYGDNLTWQHGKQTLKFGAQILRYQENRYYSGNDGTLGFFDFNSSVSDFINDNVTNEAQGAITGRWGQRQYRDAFFAQDDIKLSPSLTLNLGLRWEYDQPYTEVNNKQANINLTTGVITYAGVNGAPKALYNAYYAGFMPRLGFAWSPDILNSKFVLRGGYGITNFLEGTGANLRLTLNPPFFVDAQCTAGQPCAGGAPLRVTNGFYRPANPNVYSGNVRAWQPTLKPALIQQYNLTTEYQVDNYTSLTVAYLGQNGNHLVDPREGNQRPCLTCALPITTLSLLNPALSQISQISYTESEAVMNYNALQVTARRRSSHGFEFLANWTYSKGLSNNLGYYGAAGGAGAAQSPYWQDAYNGGGDYGPEFFDARHNISISGIYELPFGRGRQFGSGMNRIEDEVVGGWKASTIMSFHTGFPVTVNSNAAYSTAVNARASRANHLRKLKVVGRTETNWFGTDPSAQTCAADTDNGTCSYSGESAFSFGNASVGSERAPSYQQVDLALSKDFAITEGTHFEFRSDFLNAFNMVSLAPPANNASPGNGFGQISNTVNEPRNIQLALKFVF
jgi:outer membrane receptor protein involved in Fe transport